MLCAASGSGGAQTAIAVVNPSFEQDAIVGANAPVYQFDKVPRGWSAIPGETGSRGLIAPNAIDNDGSYPGATGGFDGANAVYFLHGPAGIEQVLSEPLRANTRYTLSVASGTRSTGNGSPFAGYSIRLETEDGDKIGHWIGAGRNLAAKQQFATTRRSFDTGPAPIGLGKRLRIRLSQNGMAGYADLDHVRLTRQASPSPYMAATPVEVMIVAGQSNALGAYADVNKLSEANRHYGASPDSRVLLGYRLRNLSDKADNLGSMGKLGAQGSGFVNVDGFGPELSLGSDLAVGAGRRFAVIKYAVSSAGLNQNYKKTSPTGEALYPKLLSHIQASLAELRTLGYAPRLKALFWLQGEQDTIAAADSNAYQANLSALIRDLRADAAAPELQFYLTQLNPNAGWLKQQQGTATVNGAMSAAAQADPNRVFYIETGDVTGPFADGWLHYDANQTIAIGRKWAARYLLRNP